MSDEVSQVVRRICKEAPYEFLCLYCGAVRAKGDGFYPVGELDADGVYRDRASPCLRCERGLRGRLWALSQAARLFFAYGLPKLISRIIGGRRYRLSPRRIELRWYERRPTPLIVRAAICRLRGHRVGAEWGMNIASDDQEDPKVDLPCARCPHVIVTKARAVPWLKREISMAIIAAETFGRSPPAIH